MPPEPYLGNRRALFAMWGFFWVLMIAVAVQDNMFDRYISWWEPILWEGSSCVVATAWLLLQQHTMARWNPYLAQPLKWFGIHLAWLPVLAVTFIIGVFSIRHGVYALVGRTYHHRPWPGVFLYETVKLTLFMAPWLGIIFGLASFQRWK